jgi:hypothetical protein
VAAEVEAAVVAAASEMEVIAVDVVGVRGESAFGFSVSPVVVVETRSSLLWSRVERRGGGLKGDDVVWMLLLLARAAVNESFLSKALLFSCAVTESPLNS